MNEKIGDLKKYIKVNLNEKEDGHWEYIIRPEIRSAIDNLNESDSEEFSFEILNWDEKILFHLADEIIFSENKHLDQDYLYCYIFLQVNDKDSLDYLSENLWACFNGIESETVPLDFFISMKQKLKMIWPDHSEDDNYFIEALTSIIKIKTNEN